MALLKNGTAWATGYNNFGQLGIGTSGAGTDTSVLTLMATETNSNIIAIAAGTYHTLVLRSDGKVWATGSNSSGALGNGPVVSGNKSVLTEMTTTTNSNIVAIAAGEHSVVLRNDGTVWATGLNGDGQIGIGTQSAGLRILTKMIGADNANIKAISAKGRFSVVLKSDGTVYATGLNTAGQLGVGSGFTRKLILSAMTDNNANISAISAGNNTTMALKPDGIV